MQIYYAVLHKEPDSAYGLSFPDLPGCFSAADDFKTLYAMATEAITLYLEDMEVPVQRSVEELMKNPEIAEDLAEGGALIAVPFEKPLLP